MASTEEEIDLSMTGEFRRQEGPRIDQEVFKRRFANWRVSLAGFIVIVWMLAGLYHHLEPTARTLLWAGIDTVIFTIIAITCRLYELRQPVDLGSATQKRWMVVWTFTSAAAGATSGSLPLFLPAESVELQFSSATVVSILMIAFVVSRSNRWLIYATVGAYALTLSLSLALHAGKPLAVPVCLLFTAVLLRLGLALNASMREAIGEQLNARRLHAELKRAHARQLQVQQREVALNERQRMMGDLRDAFGAQLLLSLKGLESGEIDVRGAAATLRECVDDLKLMVDAQEPAARNLQTLLGMLRHRVQPRSLHKGPQLHWEISDLNSAGPLSPAQALDLLRAMQRAISSGLRYPAAQHVLVSTRRVGRDFEISVENDGQGFDASVTLGRTDDIAAMHRRVARLGGDLFIDAREGGGSMIRIRLRWPLGAQT